MGMKYWNEMNYDERQEAIATIVFIGFWILIGIGLTLFYQYLKGF